MSKLRSFSQNSQGVSGKKIMVGIKNNGEFIRQKSSTNSISNDLDLKESSEPFVHNKVRAAQRNWSFIGLFIICLIISMPFYSANAMATTLSINTNTGTAGIDGFINSESDTWTMQATVSGYSGTVADNSSLIDPSQMFLEVGGSNINFNSCSGDQSITVCDFQNILDSGISEGAFQFDVRLYDLLEDPEDENSTNLGSELASDSATVMADGSAPSISWNSLYQDGENVYLDFDVIDGPSGSCVGIRLIEIIDSESGTILSKIELEEIGVCDFNYANDALTSGVLDATITGEGKRSFKIRATDFLGHTKTGTAKGFETDFVAPSIRSGSLELLDFGDYIGQYSQSTDVSVRIDECGGLEEVVAYSEQVEFFGQLGDCDLLDQDEYESSNDDECTYICSWDDITVTPAGASSISVTVVASDETDNEGTADLAATFSIDSSVPSVSYIGSEYQYNDYSYVPAGESSKIIAKISDSGVGITTEQIALNLKSVNGGDWEYPVSCTGDSSTDFECYWDINDPGEKDHTFTKEISVVYLEDSVGNVGETMSTELVVDGVGPIVHEIEFYGYSALGEKDYFQSNDDIVIKLETAENSGLTVYADVRDIVMDATNKYSYGENIEQDDGSSEYEASEWDGWVKFTEEDCERGDDTFWDCEFKIDSIKSGYDSSADLVLIVADTSGNPSEWDYANYTGPENVEDEDEGEFEIEIFGLDEETQPDFWEAGSVSPFSNTFSRIDLDQVEISRTKIMELISFKANLDNVLAAKIDLGECNSEDPNAPELSKVLQYSTISGLESSPEVTVLFEFENFDPGSLVDLSSMASDFGDVVVEYQCMFKIYSIHDETAMNYAEEQLVTVGIPFGYTANGAANENVEAYVYELTHTKSFQFLDSIKYVNKVFEWVRYLAPIVGILSSLIGIVSIVQVFTEGWIQNPYTKVFGIPTCMSQAGAVAGVTEVFNKISIVLQLFTCAPSPAPTTAYATYQKEVLNMYQMWRGGALLGAIPGGFGDAASGLSGGGSLYDNIYIATIGLCIPGIFYNLEKLRQIYCAEAKCLLEEVPSGMATIRTCQEGSRFMICKYFVDGLMDFVPIMGLLEGISEIIKSFLTNPLAWVNLVSTLFCTLGIAGCPTTGTGAAVCNGVEIAMKIIDSIGNIYGMVQKYPALNADICADLEVDRDYGETEEGAVTESVTTDVITADTASEGEVSEE